MSTANVKPTEFCEPKRLRGSVTVDRQKTGVERCIPLELRESSYRGIYYCGGPGIGQRFLLQENDETSRWHIRV